MSFMEGFGNAFSSSFQKSYDRAASQRDDIFKMNYANYIEGSKERRKADAAAKEEIKQAKKMTEWAGAPQEAWPTVLSWVQAGATLKDVTEKVKGGSWEKAASQSPQQSDSLLASSSMTPQQTSTEVDPRASMQQTTQMAQTSQQKASGNMMNGLLGSASGVFSSLKNNMSRAGMSEGAVRQIAAQEGITEEEVRARQSGVPSEAPSVPQSGYNFVPSSSAGEEFSAFKNLGEASQAVNYYQDILARDPNNKSAQDNLAKAQSAVTALERAKDTETNIVAGAEAKAGAEYYQVNGRVVNASQLGQLSPEEQQTAKLLSPNQAKRINDVTDKIGPRVTDLRNKVIAYEGSLNSIDTIESLARTDETLMSEWLNRANQNVSNATVGAKNMYQTVKDYAGVANEDSLESATQKVRGALGSLVQTLNQTTDVAERKAIAGRIIDAQMTLLTYDIATLQGQDGRNLAEAERKVFADIMKGGATVDGFMSNAANIMGREVDKLDSGFRGIQEDPAVKAIGAKVDWLPADSVDELLTKSGRKSSHDNLMKYRVSSKGLSDQLKTGRQEVKTEPKVSTEGMGSPVSAPKGFDPARVPPLRADSPAGIYKVGNSVLYYDGKDPNKKSSFSPIK